MEVMEIRLHAAMNGRVTIHSMYPQANGFTSFAHFCHIYWHKQGVLDEEAQIFENVIWDMVLVIKDELLQEVVSDQQQLALLPAATGRSMFHNTVVLASEK